MPLTHQWKPNGTHRSSEQDFAGDGSCEVAEFQVVVCKKNIVSHLMSLANLHVCCFPNTWIVEPLSHSYFHFTGEKTSCCSWCRRLVGSCTSSVSTVHRRVTAAERPRAKPRPATWTPRCQSTTWSRHASAAAPWRGFSTTGRPSRPC